MTSEKTIDIHPASQLVRNLEIISTKIDDETVMMDTNFEHYFGIKEVGARIWEILEHPTTLDELCEKLISEFDVSGEQCKQDILPFLTDLAEHEMVRIT